jgi:hypothetical protein
VINDPAGPVIVDNMDDKKLCPMPTGKDDRPAQGTVGTLGKIRSQHDAHGVPLRLRRPTHENTTNQFSD